MNKYVKILLTIVVTIFLMLSLIIVNAFLGNPISKAIVTNSATEYLHSQYQNTDYYIESVNYSFKTGKYHALIKSPSSEDTYFDISYNTTGDLMYDNFDSNIENRFNTWLRVTDEYNILADTAWQKVPYEFDIAFAEILTLDREIIANGVELGIDMSSLELDKEYDQNELGADYGHLTLHVISDEFTNEKCAEVLLVIREIFDEENVKFKTISLMLVSPKSENKPFDFESSIDLNYFLYDDITEDNILRNIENLLDID